jgi:meso-butanediol dehydrogenase / (S,S)-butanediol dehydrogenase / diacetyl reductase
MRFDGRVAFVTGGGSGIGRAIAMALASEGARVVIADRDAARGDGVAAEIEDVGGTALAVTTDVAEGPAITAAVEATRRAFGPVDVLVNNASEGKGDGVLEIEESTWDRDLAVALRGAFLCAKAVLPEMMDRRRGVILNIGSVNGLTALGQEAYGAAKAGLVSLTRNLAVRYGPNGVRANALAPATVRTPAWRARLEADPGIFDRLASWYPLRRVGEPEDVAKAALFLASDDAAWISGIVLVVDGGLLAGNGRLADDLLLREDDANP